MPPLRLIADTFGDELEAGFNAIRTELQVPDGFAPNVLEAAAKAAQRGPTLPPGASGDYIDRTEIDLVTIDPPDSIDLDQAYAATETSTGYRVSYAIADVAAFVHPGDPIDDEARSRGVTLYSPDSRSSLHPEALNEAAASLLPDATRPAVLWEIDLDYEGRKVGAIAQRAMVSSRRKLSYAKAQELIDAETDDESLRLLKVIGELRQTLEAERGAISLQLPAQEIRQVGDGDYELAYEKSMQVEGWNAQISLLTGMAAGDIMVEAGHGLLRTLPPLQDRAVEDVRRTAKALDVPWPKHLSYADRVRQLDPNNAAEAALLTRAARSFRGAGYDAFANHEMPEQPLHGAIAAIYAHVTAPLRRVCDRFANEIVLAHCADQPAPAWALEALEELPELMGQSRQRDRSLERAMVDFVEAVALQHRIGSVFKGTVLSHRRKGANVQLRHPAVLAGIGTKPEIGSEISLRLDSVDTIARRIAFSAVD